MNMNNARLHFIPLVVLYLRHKTYRKSLKFTSVIAPESTWRPRN